MLLLVVVADAGAWVLVGAGALALAGITSSVRLVTGTCPYCAPVAAGATATQAVGAVLVSTVGVPGGPVRPVDGVTVALVALAVTVSALLVVATLGRSRETSPGNFYAL
ncbi:hypothetical protein GCM10009821_10730 [Aeromicrobium halocynthiae]|uniref:Uncharacterized protein n=1 Tax=Aeromicrobium halocynthiae TaxID=560557 RepID=A0ABN2VW29_9ACTN